MKLTALLCITMLSTLSMTLKQTTSIDRFTFEGMDCRNPTKIASFRTKDWCSPISTNSINVSGDKKTVAILQDAKFQIVNGIRCTKQVSKFLVYCGSYSHMKLYGPPSILEPAVITTEECSDMYRRRAYIYKGKTIKIELNTVISIPMIVHGSVTNDKTNIYCQGAKFAIDGEQHSNMLAFETVQLSMVDLSIQVGDQEVQELRDMTILSPACITEMQCVHGLHMYLITSPVNKCKLKVIRTIDMIPVQLIHLDRITEYLVNHEHKLILRITDTARDDVCDVLIHHTNYPELKLIMNAGVTTIDMLHVQIDMDLELRQSEEYLMYRTEALLQSRTQAMQAHLCAMRLNSLHSMERSPFHPDSLIRSRGTIIQELRCSPCQVTATLGYSRGDLCHTEYLPVYLGDEAVYLDTMGLIVTQPVLDQVDCHGVFSPIFETVDNKLVQANPQIVEVKMTILKKENLGFHEASLDHIEDTESLLYTKAEFEA